ncbi:Quinone oxidoreductase [hydrothermal vent metagenome]|uniref:Quinone oxidoreductase n=1 Tax=hydrothermal vent metagenome TaxID=652676 RepID=A0A3B0TL61_9ZZZZ
MQKIPEQMAAIAISAPGPPEVLKLEHRAVPWPETGQILIRVEAAGVNRPDVFQRLGLYPPPPGAPSTPGLEVAGEVVAMGRGPGTRHDIGDRVTALVAGGGYAEYCLAHDAHALPIPAGLTAIQAAGLPETVFTVWSNVFVRAGLKSGEIILIHGGSSGIGTTAIQMADAFGATVYATAGSAEKCAFCEKLGAVQAFNYNSQDFVDALKAGTDGHGADVILDMVGGDYIERNFKAAAVDGRIAQIAFLRGAQADVDFSALLHKRLTLTGSTLRPRSVADKAVLAAQVEAEVWPLVEDGRVTPIIDQTFPLAQAAKAHGRMEAGSHIGKIILVP